MRSPARDLQGDGERLHWVRERDAIFDELAEVGIDRESLLSALVVLQVDGGLKGTRGKALDHARKRKTDIQKLLVSIERRRAKYVSDVKEAARAMRVEARFDEVTEIQNRLDSAVAAAESCFDELERAVQRLADATRVDHVARIEAAVRRGMPLRARNLGELYLQLKPHGLTQKKLAVLLVVRDQGQSHLRASHHPKKGETLTNAIDRVENIIKTEARRIRKGLPTKR